MESGFIAGLVTAVGAAIGGVILAVAALRRANAPYSNAMILLQRTWDWFETGTILGNPILPHVPPSLKRSFETMLRHNEKANDEDDDSASVV